MQTLNVRNGVMALVVGLASTACIDLDETDAPDESVIASDVSVSDTALYSCVFPLCGGNSIVFDSRDLKLRSCIYDSRAGVLDCEMRASDSPVMPTTFWATASAQLSCEGGVEFRCEGVSADLLSCACATAAATSGRRKFNPIIINKRIDKS